MRRAEDPFTYERWSCPSFEDALVAVLLNSEIQACVIRPRFGVVSRHITRPPCVALLRTSTHTPCNGLASAERMLLLGAEIATDGRKSTCTSLRNRHRATGRRDDPQFQRIFHRDDYLSCICRSGGVPLAMRCRSSPRCAGTAANRRCVPRAADLRGSRW